MGTDIDTILISEDSPSPCFPEHIEIWDNEFIWRAVAELGLFLCRPNPDKISWLYPITDRVVIVTHRGYRYWPWKGVWFYHPIYKVFYEYLCVATIHAQVHGFSTVYSLSYIRNGIENISWTRDVSGGLGLDLRRHILSFLWPFIILDKTVDEGMIEENSLSPPDRSWHLPVHQVGILHWDAHDIIKLREIHRLSISSQSNLSASGGVMRSQFEEWETGSEYQSWNVHVRVSTRIVCLNLTVM